LLYENPEEGPSALRTGLCQTSPLLNIEKKKFIPFSCNFDNSNNPKEILNWAVNTTNEKYIWQQGSESEFISSQFINTNNVSANTLYIFHYTDLHNPSDPSAVGVGPFLNNMILGGRSRDMGEYQRTLCHEIGHLFNLMHPFEGKIAKGCFMSSNGINNIPYSACTTINSDIDCNKSKLNCSPNGKDSHNLMDYYKEKDTDSKVILRKYQWDIIRSLVREGKRQNQ
jgi:hypothetical protein